MDAGTTEAIRKSFQNAYVTPYSCAQINDLLCPLSVSVELWEILDAWWFCSSSLSSGAALWYRGRQKGPGGCHLIHPSVTDRDCNRFGFPIVCGYNTTRQSCSGLWLLRATSGTCYGVRRECAAAHGGGCISDLLAGAPTGSAQVVPIHRKRTSIFPSFPLLMAKWKLCLLCTQRRGIFLQCSCPTCSDIFFCLSQPLSNLLVWTSYFHLDLAEDQGFGGC